MLELVASEIEALQTKNVRLQHDRHQVAHDGVRQPIVAQVQVAQAVEALGRQDRQQTQKQRITEATTV